MNSFDCGNITGAGYPFSGSDRPGYCGYPGFELRCINQDPEITIMGSTYKLHGINNQSRTLNVSRTDYTENLCPTLLSNTSLSPNLLSSNSDHGEVLLYYGCPSPNPSGFSAQFTCNINDTDMMGYFVTVNNSVLSMTAPILITYLTACNNKVIVPAHQSAILPILGNPTIAQLLGAINQGFDLVWSANDSLCDTCKSSGGQCGYDQTTTAFTCFCADQPQEFECTESPQASSPSTTLYHREQSLKYFQLSMNWDGLFLQRYQDLAQQVLLLVPFWDAGSWPLIQRRRRKAALEKSEELPIATPSSKGPATSINLSRTTPSLTSLKSDIDKGSTYFGVRVFSYDELEEVTNFFDSSRELGDGGFGTVYYGVLRDGHENLVKLHGCTSRHSRELLLVYEYIPNGTVADHLHGRQSSSGLLTWPVRLSIAIETASALAHLHASEEHLDMLIPEYYQCYQLTSKSDVYSFGVVLIELISSLQAVDTNRHRHDINLSNMAVNMIQNQALNELVDPFLGFDKNLEVRMMVTSVAELAFRCLQRQREMRPSMEEVLEVLKRIEKEDDGAEKAEVLDISEDDVGLLKHDSSPLKLSEDSLNDQFWESSSSTKTPHSF
ncbi:hypothetical protein OIU77_001515 [Salix suchowensis]|uniref:non-specific serine/threonine protein kinase n=1 Tax=Salix suchowensis TaxID=1278906 RepID=A0ABQ9B3T1_9ROSI|nr:hypothetical protein OIU77_001515 [Salix suchowensis]